MTTAAFQPCEVNQMRVHVLPTDKYKTNTIVINIQRPLTPEAVTQTALLPQVLRQGTNAYPSQKQMKEHLDDLYGATFYGNVMKRGERHILQFGLDIANERYLSESPPLLTQGIAFLGDVLTAPATEEGGFVAKYIRTEKQNLRQRIDSLIDDKMRYAAERCIQEMCREEPFGLFNYGDTEQLDRINGQSLYETFQTILRESVIDVFVVGDVDVDEVTQAVGHYLSFERGTIQPLSVSDGTHAVAEIRQVIDELDVQQGKLNLGLRTQTTVADEDYVALMVYNGVLGGFPHSKLFTNVREKESLAYYVASRLESHKGLMTIQSGIDIHNFDRALSIIKKQLDDMQSGKITDTEIEKTRIMLANQLRSIQDQPHQLINFHYHGILAGRHRPLDDLLKQLTATTKQDLEKMGHKVTLDTVYFLRNQQEQEG